MFMTTYFNHYRGSVRRGRLSVPVMILILISVAPLLTNSNGAPQSVSASQPPAAELTDANFEVRSYIGKCLSYGAPIQAGVGEQPQANNSPVYIYDCNGGRPVAQPVVVGAVT